MLPHLPDRQFRLNDEQSFHGEVVRELFRPFDLPIGRKPSPGKGRM